MMHHKDEVYKHQHSKTNIAHRRLSDDSTSTYPKRRVSFSESIDSVEYLTSGSSNSKSSSKRKRGRKKNKRKAYSKSKRHSVSANHYLKQMSSAKLNEKVDGWLNDSSHPTGSGLMIKEVDPSNPSSRSKVTGSVSFAGDASKTSSRHTNTDSQTGPIIKELNSSEHLKTEGKSGSFTYIGGKQDQQPSVQNDGMKPLPSKENVSKKDEPSNNASSRCA